MKVLLTKDVEDLGFAGELFDVSPGYARNFLIPQRLAIIATDGALKQAKAWMEQAAGRREQQRQQFAALVERLNNTTLEFFAKAGEKGKLYGSITTADIADKLKEALDIDVDRRWIDLEGKSLRNVGTHTVSVRLDGEFQANNLKVSISPEKGGAETAAQVTESDVEEEEEAEIAEV